MLAYDRVSKEGWWSAKDAPVYVARQHGLIIISSLSGSCAGLLRRWHGMGGRAERREVQGGVEENFGGVSTVYGRSKLSHTSHIPPATCHLLQHRPAICCEQPQNNLGRKQGTVSPRHYIWPVEVENSGVWTVSGFDLTSGLVSTRNRDGDTNTNTNTNTSTSTSTGTSTYTHTNMNQEQDASSHDIALPDLA